MNLINDNVIKPKNGELLIAYAEQGTHLLVMKYNDKFFYSCDEYTGPLNSVNNEVENLNQIIKELDNDIDNDYNIDSYSYEEILSMAERGLNWAICELKSLDKHELNIAALKLIKTFDK